LAVLALAILGGAGYGIYAITQKDKDSDKPAVVSHKQDIAQLNVGVIGGSIALYPKGANDSYAQTISQQVYEGLVKYEDQTKVVPLLATGWNNPDSSTWDFDLRKDVTFHNGHTMKAADVVDSLNAARENKDLSMYSDTMQDVKALNDYKVEIKTAKPDAFLLNKLSYLMILDSKDLAATDTSNATGPYELKSGTQPTDTGIQLTAFDKYHGGHVYVRNLNITVESDEETASKDFKAGKINMVGEYNSAEPDQLKGVSYHKITVDDPGVTFMTINSTATGPLQNVKVRQAIKDSIDIEALINNVGVSAEPASQLLTKALPGYDPSIPVAKRDIAKAKQLLTEAGYPNGLTLTVEVASSGGPVGNEIARQAKEAGITLNVVVESNFDKLVEDLSSGKTQLTVLAYSSDLQDGSEVFDTVLRQSGNYKSADLDKYLSDVTSTVDQEKRLKDLQQASQTTVEDVAAIPLFNRQRTWLMDKPYTVQFDTIASDPGVYFWKAYLSN
jgi:peptide/nickel transport system substrate-binding protein